MTKKPHKHAELIKLWADGAEVEVMRESNGVWGSTPTPIWDPARKYRIKPEPSYKYEWHDIPDDDYWKTECEKARKELAKVTRDRDKFKAMPMKYRRMTFNVELQEQLTAAKQLIEQVKELLKINDENSDEILSLIAEYQKGGE